ncbi:hypothetical protein JD844_022185 [Phrynosoma platyrhinos]|uniref:P2X purinoceptor n=1 Tax=Phrynosoma platyrhinos TaxID=52577 RepID=A0ABQ7SVP0_PHRPL|nr:hypothetical protein JD844_022185 [Phrynosoma platyrhinos]
MTCVADFFTYETTKSVVVKSWTIGVINRAVQLLIISYFIGIDDVLPENVDRWVFLHEKAYQIRDTSIESSVVTKVKGFGKYSNQVMDTADYVTPPQIEETRIHAYPQTKKDVFPLEEQEKHEKMTSANLRASSLGQKEGQGTSVFVIITKLIVTENQVQGFCPENQSKYKCKSNNDCKRPVPTTGGVCFLYSLTFQKANFSHVFPYRPVMLEAENFTLFIKNSIRFPLFNFEKGNLLPNLTTEDIQKCRFHPAKQPFCPILRLGDIVKFADQNFSSLAMTVRMCAVKGGIIGIKIGWVCDLDHSEEHCIPRYSFNRLDSVSERSKVSRGYNFRQVESDSPESKQHPEMPFSTAILYELRFFFIHVQPHSGLQTCCSLSSPTLRYARYYKRENGTEFRTLMKAYGIRFDVLVYGNAGKFNIIPTLINTVAAFTSVGVGTVLCDIILLNFLKGADQYKAKKFEEVSEKVLHPDTISSPVYQSNQTLGGRCEEKQSTDSGAFSIGL